MKFKKKTKEFLSWALKNSLSGDAFVQPPLISDQDYKNLTRHAPIADDSIFLFQLAFYHEINGHKARAVTLYRRILQKQARHRKLGALSLMRLEHLGFNPQLEPPVRTTRKTNQKNKIRKNSHRKWQKEPRATINHRYGRNKPTAEKSINDTGPHPAINGTQKKYDTANDL